MNKQFRYILGLALIGALSFAMIGASSNKPFEGYTLMAPMRSTTTYLLNNAGKVVHTWTNKLRPGLSAYLLENGNLLRTAHAGETKIFTAGGSGGKIEILDWNSKPVWEYEYSSPKFHQHHDVKMMPNGNVIFVAWDRKTKEEAIAAGRDPKQLKDSELWPDSVIEVKPTGPKSGKIVWEWHIWDHLIQDHDRTKDNFGNVGEHPELIDLNFIGTRNARIAGGKDWTHMNSVAYNPELDQVMVSIHEFSEIWVIDHSTTTKEAKGHKGGKHGKGGDLLYRWGNPRAYRAGDTKDQILFGQHDAKWIDKGLPGARNILIYNNGLDQPGTKYSTIVEIKPPVKKDGTYTLDKGRAYAPAKPEWTYKAEDPASFFSPYISGAQRLPNGNTLICSGGNGTLFEVTQSGETVWKYVNKFSDDTVKPGSVSMVTSVFKVERYAPDYAGLKDKLKK